KAANARRITMGLGLRQFTFSPDGRKLLAVKAKSQSQLWSFPTNLECLTARNAGRPLLANGFMDETPCPTPDGLALLVTSHRRGMQDIWRLTIGAANPKRLTNGSGNMYAPIVTPDGQWIAFNLLNQQGSYIHVMRPDGSDVHLLAPLLREKFSSAISRAWSPD